MYLIRAWHVPQDELAVSATARTAREDELAEELAAVTAELHEREEAVAVLRNAGKVADDTIIKYQVT